MDLFVNGNPCNLRKLRVHLTSSEGVRTTSNREARYDVWPKGITFEALMKAYGPKRHPLILKYCSDTLQKHPWGSLDPKNIILAKYI